MKLRYLALSFLFLLPLSVHADDEVIINKIETAGNRFEPEKTISIYGDNFGTDEDALKVYIGEKAYNVDASYGKMLDFQLDKYAKSGEIYIKKSVEEEGQIIKVKSNHLNINLGEPDIQSVEAPNGLIPKESLHIQGSQFQDAHFWCGEIHEFTILSATKEEATLKIPEDFLNCSVIVKRNGFEFDSEEKLKVTIFPTLSRLEFKDNYAYLKGKGFSVYANNIKDLSLLFNKQDTLSNAEFISDEEIRFSHSAAVDYSGIVSLQVEETVFPAIPYAVEDTFNYITNITTPYKDDDLIIFTISLNKELNGAKIKMNGASILGDENEKEFIAKQQNLPPASGEIWIEENNFRGRKFQYDIDVSLAPYIRYIEASDELNESSGELKIFGSNFDNSTRISSSISNLEVKDLSASELYTSLPFNNKEGEYTISVINDYGSSEPVIFSIPSHEGKQYYPTPNITEFEFPEGAIHGRKIIVHGTGFSNITSINFNDLMFKPSWATTKLLEAIIPEDVAFQGVLTITSNNKVLSNELPYSLIERPKNESVQLDFPLNDEVKVAASEEFQNLLSFSFLNTKKNLEVERLEFQLHCESQCFSPLPFIDYKLVDNEGVPVPDAYISIDIQTKKIIVHSFQLPFNLEKQIFTLQVKSALSLLEDQTHKLTLESSVVVDENEDSVYLERIKESKIVDVAAEKNATYYCKKFIEDKWEDCSSNIGTTSDTSPEENSEIQDNTTEEVLLENTMKIISSDTIEIPKPDLSKKANFSDIHQNDWFMEHTQNLVQRGIINGYADGTFQPAGELNRAELIKMVIVARGESWGRYSDTSFRDTEKHWARDMLEYALEKGYVKPVSSFEPLKPVTRAETVKMMCKMFPSILKETETATHFIDMGDHWAKNCVMSAYSMGIIKGASATEFKPNDKVTRAEFTKILSKVLDFF